LGIAALAVVLTATSNAYGYHRDELYFRMLHPSWGYIALPLSFSLRLWSDQVFSPAWKRCWLRLVAGGWRPRWARAIYAVVTYVTGFVAWEIPRTVRQSQLEYAAKWRREFASLTPAAFPMVSGVLDQLADVAGADHFEFGLAALVAGLAA